jgi:SAM-dependent methyltransferase
MPTTERLKEAAASIRPARMIKLGEDSPRSVRPGSAVERVPSSHPAAEPVPPPLPDFGLPPPPAFAEDLRTQPRQPVPPPPTSADSASDEEEVDEVAPETEEFEAPKAKPPKRPPPRSRVESKPSEPAPDLDQTPTPAAKAEVVAAEGAGPPKGASETAEPAAKTPESPVVDADEPAPDSGEDRLSLEDAEPVSTPALPPPRASMQTLDDGTRDDKTATKKPPPPPKRSKSPSLPGTDPESSRAEAPSQQRAKRWWEELFTEDFGRTLFPLTPKQIGREVDFIEESLGVAKGGIVMDLGCGAGHHAVELSSRGYGVVGLDLSLLQLMIAADNAQERSQKINFLQADMRDMSFDSVFDGIYSWDTSFGYFEEDKNTAVIERVFRALRPGGNFLLDVINRDFVVEHQPSQVWFEGDACVCMDDMSVDFITSRLRVKRTLMLDDGRSRELVYSMRIYSLHELGKILHGAGFRVIEASGHVAYPGTFLGATSPRVMILAQKP